jgi:hypothetical protein
VQGYLVSEGTVGQAVAAFQAGQLQPMAGANVAAHAGMGGGRRMGRRPGAPPAAPESLDAARDAELAALRETLKGLRQQLAETMTRIENLEKEA